MTCNPLQLLIVKVASRCNLACSYCYYYNSGDESWRDRPVIMDDATFTAMVQWARRQVAATGQDHITLLFHGGEPLLIGADRFDAWCREATTTLDGINVTFGIQTNGVLIDDRWTDVLARHRVLVGVSLDGPMEVHDAFRVDHRGRGSYERVLAGTKKLHEARIPWGVLAVVDLEHDPLEIHRHLVDVVGAPAVDYLLPDQTHETIGVVRSRYGPTPAGDWLISVFDDWWARDSLRVRIRILDAIVGSLVRKQQLSGQFGNPPLGYLTIEADGSVEGVDVLKIGGPGLVETGLTVWSDEPAVTALPDAHREMIFDGVPLPTGCRGCREAATCGGGYLPHRFSRRRGHDNPSAWCADIYKLFGHVRDRLGLTDVPSPPPLVAAGGPPPPR
jgi:uncharacterized protein